MSLLSSEVIRVEVWTYQLGREYRERWRRKNMENRAVHE